MNLHELVIESAKRRSDRIAVVGPSGALRYGELDQLANMLAHRLLQLGARYGDRVVIWAEKSAAAVAAMQAVLRTGAAYVPADEATPPGRIVAMVEDCAARVVCTTDGRIAQVAPLLPAAVQCLDLATSAAGPIELTAPIAQPVLPDDLAYILYTSGSTGAPKGVCISHRNARAFVDWAVATLKAGPDDRFANHAPLTFDLSVLDLYAAFAAGASVYLVPSALGYAPAQLTEFLYRHQISIWYSVPSALILMMRDGGMLDHPAPTALRAVIFAGEPFPIAYVRDLFSWISARLINLYGPTETNVCTGHEVMPDDLLGDRPVPIGKATSGDTVWAEKPDGSVAGPGDEGELLVDGPTVMLGYWGHAPHRGPYRTGDLARMLSDGSFEYIGRRDQMVKVRGHRIELGEVEAALAAHPDVAEVAVTVTGTGMSARLEAFIVARHGHEPSVLSLKRHIAQKLPRYMIVDEVHAVSQLPRTRTGKTDRSALKAPGADHVVAQLRRSS